MTSVISPLVRPTFWRCRGESRPVSEIKVISKGDGATLRVEVNAGPVYTIPKAEVAAFCTAVGIANPYARK